ncbi:hypothetical protein GJ496_010883 [Pomphorhynchus laevis]|nr:hypothetical protein GJ496_010883 [Pomphorhynchus laevis]
MNALIALCHFCDCHGPRTIMCTQAINKSEELLVKELILTSSENQHNTATRDTCKSCQLLSEKENCLVSYDDENEVYYISSDCPRNASTFHLVRTACLRSLYTERTQGRGGSILFGHGNCMVGCSTFFLKDIHSRGQTRLYSLQIILNDKFMSTSCWSYLIDQFTRIIDQLKECSYMVFDHELGINPARPVRCSYMPNTIMDRSLSELTALPDISYRLHSWFTWILRSLPQLINEEILEGQPTDDHLHELELAEESLESSTQSNDNNKTICNHDYSTINIDNNDALDPSSTSLKQDVKNGPDPDSSLSKPACLNVEDQRTILLISSKLEEQNHKNMIRSLENIRILSRKLGINKFRLLVYHVTIGNQIVVRCEDKDVIQSAIQSLELLLPKRCCQTVYFSDVYIESFRANFLGMPLLTNNMKRQSIVGPADGRYIFLDVFMKHSRNNRHSNGVNYIVKVRAKILVPNTLPKISQKLVNLITNNQIPAHAALSHLHLLKQDWLQKSKIFYVYTRANASATCNNYELYKSLEIEGSDLSVLLFWQKGISLHIHQQILLMQAEHIRLQNQKQKNQCQFTNNTSNNRNKKESIAFTQHQSTVEQSEDESKTVLKQQTSTVDQQRESTMCKPCMSNGDCGKCDENIVEYDQSTFPVSFCNGERCIQSRNSGVKAASLLTLNEIKKFNLNTKQMASVKETVALLNSSISIDNEHKQQQPYHEQQKQLQISCQVNNICQVNIVKKDLSLNFEKRTAIALSNHVSVRSIPTIYNAVARRSAAI